MKLSWLAVACALAYPSIAVGQPNESDAAALVPVTDRVAYLEEGDVADVRRDGYAIWDAQGQRAERAVVTVKAAGAVELGPYSHYMQKEIFEQPRAVSDTLEGIARIQPALFGVDGGL